MVKEFENFKNKYDGFMKWSVKQAGKVMQDQENFDIDELYGMCTTMFKKAMDLSNSAMELVKWECETMDKLMLETKKAQIQNMDIKAQIAFVDAKLDGISAKLDETAKKEKEKKEK